MNENKLLVVVVWPAATVGPLLDVGPFTAPKLNTGAGLLLSAVVEPRNENGVGLVLLDERLAPADGRVAPWLEPENVNRGAGLLVLTAEAGVAVEFAGVKEKGGGLLAAGTEEDDGGVTDDGGRAAFEPVNENKGVGLA